MLNFHIRIFYRVLIHNDPFKQRRPFPRGIGAGKVERWKLPEGASEFCVPSEKGRSRVDSGVTQGDEIGVFYDPMIAKIICKGETRDEALQELHKSLTALQVRNDSFQDLHPSSSRFVAFRRILPSWNGSLGIAVLEMLS